MPKEPPKGKLTPKQAKQFQGRKNNARTEQEIDKAQGRRSNQDGHRFRQRKGD